MSLNDSVGKSKDQGPPLTVLDSSSTRFTSLLCVVVAFSLSFFFFFFFLVMLGEDWGVYVQQRTQKHTHGYMQAHCACMHQHLRSLKA